MFIVSADSHIDLHWLPPTLFTDNASVSLKTRMPGVHVTPDGPRWMTAKGANFGMPASVGATGRPYRHGMSHRADRMAMEGIYEDGARGVLRLTDPHLRIKDQDRDGVSAEVIYGLLGASLWIRDIEASVELARIYNDWLVNFCAHYPERLLGLASIPSHTPEIAIEEIERVARNGGIRGLDISGGDESLPLYHPAWDRFWATVEDTGLPVHFHTLGPRVRDTREFSALDINRAKAEALANCQ